MIFANVNEHPSQHNLFYFGRSDAPMRALTALFLLAFLAAPARGQLFTDNFTRGADPGPLTPWVIQSGGEVGAGWSTGGALVGGANGADSFGFAYVTNNWTDYS